MFLKARFWSARHKIEFINNNTNSATWKNQTFFFFFSFQGIICFLYSKSEILISTWNAPGALKPLSLSSHGDVDPNANEVETHKQK